ncbi:MAG TPA: LLM class flavin-dependent oxidoreductase, partial [Acetobacteraceae bacterium]|nr:LLM class flavin-dependent oxidoreductase [Acetobacteraceae bacterium]
IAHTVTIRPEPISLLSALAAATSRVGLAATISTTYNEPYPVARKFATLDHLSRGRAAMNVVTSSTWQEARNFGQEAHMDHATRYRRAAEFVAVVRGLWDSWEDGAVVADQATGRFADPRLVHHLDHEGEFFAVRGPLNVPRPPQGHPVIIQAGVSEDGQALAASIADLVFTVNASLEEAQARYAATKARVAQAGRAPGNVKILPGLMPVVAETEAQAREEYAALQALTPPEIGIAYLSDLVDHDLSAYPPDGPLPDLPAINGGVGRFKMIERLAREDGLTLGQIAHRMLLARGHWTVIGDPRQVADEMERWFTAGACDGFNILAPHHPAGLDAFVDLVVPELQRRDLFRREYAGTTLREHLGLPRPANQFSSLSKVAE